MPIVELPPKKTGGEKVQISDARSIVIVGANGTGKTRMGAYVEKAAGAMAHRVSAQRALVIPQFVQPQTHDQAQSTLLYGNYQPSYNRDTYVANRLGNRWQGEPYTFMLNDFQQVLALLFADEDKRNRDYTRPARETLPDAHPPKCKLEKLQEIWSAVMPQRSMVIGDNRIEAKSANGGLYEARHMSDGERVALYLAGQALCAPESAVVIIDEPELHIHRAVQALLWNEIESKRPDCTFVYITHDLDFAASRFGARRIWLKDYDGADWEWEEIDLHSSLPDALVFQVLGARRAVWLVEGEDSSYDARIYSALFPRELIVSCGPCDKVIEATKALRANASLHRLQIRGLVDRDRRPDAEIEALKNAGVNVVDVAEVENLLCLPEALEAAAIQLKCPDVDKAKTTAQSAVLAELAKLIDQQALSRALAEIQFRLNGFGPKIGDADATKLEKELAVYVEGIKVTATVEECRKHFVRIVEEKDYGNALRFFNCKGIVAFVARSLGVEKETYADIVLGCLKDEPNGALGMAMRRKIE